MLRFIALGLAITSICLCGMMWPLERLGLGVRGTVTGQDPFFYLLWTYEPQMLAFSAAGFLALYALIRRPRLVALWPPGWPGSIAPRKLGQLAVAGLLITILVGLGRHFAFHDYDVCSDESLTHFQSEVFLSGHLLGPIPVAWQPFSNASVAPLLTVHPEQENWCSEFLPVHSFLRIPETWLGFDGYTCALYFGLNLVLFYYLLRRLWPYHPTRAAVGLVLLATFPQALITSMTSYAMETYVLLTTIWLLLYTSDNPKLFLLTPWLGILCIGIHQPHIHPIFAAPFVLLLALQRRFFEFFYFCIVYLAGLLFWVSYLQLIRPSSVGDGLLDKFGFRSWLQLMIQSGNVVHLLGWSPLLLCLLFPAALISLRRKDAFIICCLVALGSLVMLHFAWPTQGHGWGDRFLCPAIPFMLIVGLHGLGMLRRALGRRGLLNLVAFTALFTMAVALPYRLWEVDQFESTHRAVHDVLYSTDADVVLLDAAGIWYGRDFVQNNPAMTNRPVVLSLTAMTPAQLALLRKQNRSLKFIGIDDLRATGQPAAFMREQD